LQKLLKSLILGNRQNIPYQFCGFILSLNACPSASGSLKEKDSSNLLLLARVAKILIIQRDNSVAFSSASGSEAYTSSCLE